MAGGACPSRHVCRERAVAAPVCALGAIEARVVAVRRQEHRASASVVAPAEAALSAWGPLGTRREQGRCPIRPRPAHRCCRRPRRLRAVGHEVARVSRREARPRRRGRTGGLRHPADPACRALRCPHRPRPPPPRQECRSRELPAPRRARPWSAAGRLDPRETPRRGGSGGRPGNPGETPTGRGCRARSGVR